MLPRPSLVLASRLLLGALAPALVTAAARAAEPATARASEPRPAEPATQNPPPPSPPKPGNGNTTAGNGNASPAPPPALDRLRAEHAAIKDQLFRSRARRETLANAVLSTQLETVLIWEGGKQHLLKAAELRLDGVRVWDAAETPPGDRPVTLAARGVAPGSHVLGVRIEVRARDNPKLGYVSEQTFSLLLTEGKKTSVEITIDEDGDPPDYHPDVEVEIEEKR